MSGNPKLNTGHRSHSGMNRNMNKTDSILNEIDILGDFNLNLSLIFSKENMFNNKSVPSDVKRYNELCTFF